MTLTAPIPLPTLADRIRAGEHPVTHSARLPDLTGASQTVVLKAIADVRRSLRAAIERTLDSVGVPIDAGYIAHTLTTTDHGYDVTAEWRPF